MTVGPWIKDTVAADEEDDEVDADQYSRKDWSSISHDAIVHHSVPVLACEDLRPRKTDTSIF